MNFRIFLFSLPFLLVAFYSIANINDYLVGLKAYKDGFNDIAKENLENYLKSVSDKKNEVFARYILAHIYFDEKNYKKTLEHINLIEDKRDERINIDEIKTMKIYALVNTNCNDAKAYLSKNLNNEVFNIYFQSECKKDDEFIDILCSSKALTDVKLKIMYNLNKFEGNVDKFFKCFDLKDLKDNDLSNLGLYYYKGKSFNYFWKIYDIYKDSILVNLALERLWFLSKYNDFLKTFQENQKQHKIEKINYCRALRIYNEKNITYNCNLLDRCLQGDKTLYDSKLACYLNNKQIDELSNYIKENSGNKALLNALCSNGPYIISNKLYNKVILKNLSHCSKKIEYVKMLLEMENFNDITIILDNPDSEEEYFYLAIVYKKLNNEIKYSEMQNKIKDIELLKALNNY